MPTVIADAHHTQRGHLPVVMIIDLGYGDVEFTLDSPADRLDYLPFTFEAAVFRQTQPDPQYPNVHLGKQALVVLAPN